MIIHIVKHGDTVLSIANQYGVSEQSVAQINHITSHTRLVVGQALLVLIPQNTYTVQNGDTLNSIAQKFSTSVTALLQNNPKLINSPYLTNGEELVISYKGAKLNEIQTNGYAYTNIDRQLLKSTLPYLTYLTIWGYGFTQEGGLISADDEELIKIAYEYKTAPVMVLSSITEEGIYDSHKASELFNNPILRERVISNIVTVMQEKGYVGLDVNFEYVDSKDEPAFLQFIESVTATLHSYGYFVSVSLEPQISNLQYDFGYNNHSYYSVGNIVDRVLLMTYGWASMSGPPMPIAPINRVNEVARYAVSQIRPDKIFLGIPNYGYDWALPPVGASVYKAVTIGNDQAIDIARRSNSQIGFDSIAQTPFFGYTSSNGTAHTVWFEDVRSIYAKLSLLSGYDLRGCFYWNLMRAFTVNWPLLSSMYNIQKTIA